MRYTFLLIFSLLLISAAFSQDQNTKESRKQASERKKQQRETEMENQFRQTDTLLTGKRFVLEANYLKFSSGDRVPVTATLNFITVDSLSSTIQVGSYQRAGYNGLGGFTEGGRVSNWNLRKDEKRKNFFLSFTVTGDYGTYDINMSIDYTGYSDATLNSIRSGSITFQGNVVSDEESSVFKGQKH
jgi:hypothetical protein